MNVKKHDYIGLVEEIQTARGKDFSPKQSQAIIDELKTLEWKEAFRLTVLITRLSNLPNNTYGLVLNRIDEIKQENNKKLESRETWQPATEDCASPEEFKLIMNVMGIICRFTDSKNMCIKNSERMKEAEADNSLLDYLKRAYAYYSEQVSKRPDLLKSQMPFRVN